jgi:hypothetical protein
MAGRRRPRVEERLNVFRLSVAMGKGGRGRDVPAQSNALGGPPGVLAVDAETAERIRSHAPACCQSLNLD